MDNRISYEHLPVLNHRHMGEDSAAMHATAIEVYSALGEKPRWWHFIFNYYERRRTNCGECSRRVEEALLNALSDRN